VTREAQAGASPGTHKTTSEDVWTKVIDAGGDFGRCRMKPEWCGKTKNPLAPQIGPGQNFFCC